MIWLATNATVLAQPAAVAPPTENAWASASTAALSLKRVAWRRGSFLDVRSAWVGDPDLGSQQGNPAAALGYRLDAL